MTKTAAEATYLKALESFRLIASAHTAVTLRYRNREIGDAAYMASRRSMEEASRVHDIAEAAYVAETMPAFEDYQLPDGRIVAVDATAAKGERQIGFTLVGGEIVTATKVVR